MLPYRERSHLCSKEFRAEEDHQDDDQDYDPAHQGGDGGWRPLLLLLLLDKHALQFAVHQIVLICLLPLEIQTSVEITQ